MFSWKGKRVVMRPISLTQKPTKEEEPKFISICNRGESSVDSKETKQGLTLLVKEEVTPHAEIHEKMKPLLREFKEIVHDKLLEELLSMRDIQHHGTSILHSFEDPFMRKEFSKDDLVHCSID